MGDKEIIRLKENGGVIQINFGSAFLTQESQDKRNENNKRVEAYKNQYNLNDEDEKLLAFREKIFKRNPIYADVKDVIKHIDHVVNIAGIDHVGLGNIPCATSQQPRARWSSNVGKAVSSTLLSN